MTIRPCLRKYAGSALALLTVSSGADAVRAQQPGPVEGGASVASEAPRSVTVDGSMSSTEQGRTPLPDSFQSGREWRLEKRRGALRDTEYRFNIRSYYFDREKFDGSASQAFTIGGSVGLKTGYFLDHISFGATGYTSQGLYAPDDRDGTGLLKPGQESITVLGEAYADIRIIKDMHLYVGRKEYDTPFINGDDSRMIPHTFEAIVLQGRIAFGKDSTDASKDGVEQKEGGSVLKYGVGYFDRIKLRNSDEFIAMAEAAGAEINRGVYTAGALYETGNFTIGAIDYYCRDIINIGYAETTLKLPINVDWESKFAAQFVDQRSVGDNLLQADNFAGQQFGIKAELQFRSALFTVGYTYTDGTNMQAPWSSYPGYTSVQVQDFNRAGEGAFLARAGYEFTKIKGLSTYALAVFGSEPEDMGQYAQNEYNFNVQWKPPEGLLKGLSLRLRYALVQQDGDDVRDLQDFRFICNYGLTF